MLCTVDEGGEGGSSNRATAKASKKGGKDAPPEDYEPDEELRGGKEAWAGGRAEAATYDEPDEVSERPVGW